MALDIEVLFETVLDPYVTAVNQYAAIYTTLDNTKAAIFTGLEAQDLEDHYVDIPEQMATMEASVQSWIGTTISNIEGILTDETYVLEELPIFETDVTSVLNAIFDQMIDESLTIQSSVVSLGGSDVDQAKFPIDADPLVKSSAQVFLTRILDGVNPPSALVDAHTSYANVESQLAKSCTVYAKVISSSLGAETLQLFADSPFEASYTGDTESPGTGPTIANIEGSNLIPSNYDFSSWSSDNPTGWTLAGGSAGTAWEDQSSAGDGPLRINTAGVTCKQQITGLERRTMYFFGAHVRTMPATPGNDVDWKFRIENVDGGTVHKNFGTFVVLDTGVDGSDLYNYVYGFYCPSDDVNLDDIYVCLEYDAETAGGDYGLVYKIICSEVSYYNGLGFVFWNPYAENSTGYIRSPRLVDDYGSIAVSNSNVGVFQTFFRKAFNIQLPTADSPSISDPA